MGSFTFAHPAPRSPPHLFRADHCLLRQLQRRRRRDPPGWRPGHPSAAQHPLFPGTALTHRPFWVTALARDPPPREGAATRLTPAFVERSPSPLPARPGGPNSTKRRPPAQHPAPRDRTADLCSPSFLGLQPGAGPCAPPPYETLFGKGHAVPTMETPGPGLRRRPSPWRPGVQLRLYFSSRALGHGDWRGSVSRPCAQTSQLHGHRIMGRRGRAQKGKSANL